MSKKIKKQTEKEIVNKALKDSTVKDKLYIKIKPSNNNSSLETEHSAKESKWFHLGTSDVDLLNSTISHITNLCAKGTTKIDQNSIKQTNAALAAIVEIAPQDSIELMLATQMVTVHAMVMETSKRAMLEGQTFEGREANANRAIKLMRTYTLQMEALNKHRTKGQQKITVQHVNVNDGGQAVVGNINNGGG